MLRLFTESSREDRPDVLARCPLGLRPAGRAGSGMVGGSRWPAPARSGSARGPPVHRKIRSHAGWIMDCLSAHQRCQFRKGQRRPAAAFRGLDRRHPASTSFRKIAEAGREFDPSARAGASSPRRNEIARLGRRSTLPFRGGAQPPARSLAHGSRCGPPGQVGPRAAPGHDEIPGLGLRLAAGLDYGKPLAHATQTVGAEGGGLEA